MSTNVEAVSRQTIGDGFHIAMVYHQLENRIQLATRLENCLLDCQDKDANYSITLCLSFCSFFSQTSWWLAFSCVLEVVKLVLLAAAYDGVVFYADEHKCWNLLSCPKFYYIGIMELTRWDHFPSMSSPQPQFSRAKHSLQQPLTLPPSFPRSQPLHFPCFPATSSTPLRPPFPAQQLLASSAPPQWHCEELWTSHAAPNSEPCQEPPQQRW